MTVLPLSVLVPRTRAQIPVASAERVTRVVFEMRVVAATVKETLLSRPFTVRVAPFTAVIFPLPKTTFSGWNGSAPFGGR